MNPESLCARILKARYYPETNFMNAAVPKSASATWRAIAAGREALRAGLIKRVGDGSSIAIWEDKWIQGTRSMSPLFRPPSSDLTKVSELIDTYNWTWKVDLVRATFITPDAEAILNIPLRSDDGDGFLAWAHEITGVYSVKTAYRALTNQKELSAHDEGTATGTSTTDEQMWTKLWKLNVMPKVRVFWWRVIRGILPDEATLKYRHITETNICKLCMAEKEDLMHALLHCSHAHQFWDEASSVLGTRRPRLHPHTWARDVLCDSRFSDKDRSMMISVMWSIWHSRNRWTHDSEGYNPTIVVKHIRESLALLDVPHKQALLLPRVWLETS